MNTHKRSVWLPAALAVGLMFLGGCRLSNLMHKTPDSDANEYSSTGHKISTASKKKSWLERLNLDNLRDERAVEVDRHMAGGF